MNTSANQWRLRVAKSFLALTLVLGIGQLMGCEVDSFFDPSRTGRFEHSPTTIPILSRIDVIEPEDDLWGQTSSVRPDDLLPSDLTYVLSAGDVLTVEIFELYVEDQWSTSTRRIDAGGYLRVPELGDVPAAGLTAQELEDDLRRRLAEKVIQDPQVDVVVEEFSGFTFTTYGAVVNPGVYTLRNPDLRLLDALAIAGGVPPTTEKVFVVREIALTDEVRPAWETESPRQRSPKPSPEDKPADIEDLIKQLPDKGDGPNLGMFRQDQDPPVDIDEVEPAQEQDKPVVDIDELDQQQRGDYQYDPEKGEWVGPELMLERVIEIPYQRLSRGDSSYNIVIRPNDRVYVDGPTLGVVYIDGEILRAGVYNLPPTGQLTLSRLVAAAGGLGPLAIPQRVDLTRVVGKNREATVRLNLGAIRQRTEPDLILKPDDHIIIGTNWWAAPLAVMRNGFRATYGWGFILDRNFGNDVFGAPPSNLTTGN